MGKMMSGIYTLWLRSMKRYFRSPSRIVGSLGLPLFFLVIVGFGLNSILSNGGQSYVGFLGPGIAAVSVLFASVFAGIQIIWDKQFGFLKETLVAPVSRLQIMLGQTLGGASTAFIQGIIIMVIASLVAFHVSSIVGFLIAFGFMILIGLAFTSFGIAIASRMEDMSGFQLIMNFVIFPIFGLSGAIYPLNSIPQWLKIVTYFDPLTYGVEGVRYGLLGTSAINPLLCLAALGGFAAAMITVGALLFRKVKF